MFLRMDNEDIKGKIRREPEGLIKLEEVSEENEEEEAEYDPNQFLQDENVSLTSPSLTTIKSRTSRSFCRICHDIEVPEQSISPCHCRGTLSQVHKSCLEQWLAASDSSYCEVCGYSYTTYRHLKYSVAGSFLAWLTSEDSRQDRRMIIFDIIICLATAPLLLIANHLCFSIAELLGFDDEPAEIQLPFANDRLYLNEAATTAGRISAVLFLSGVGFFDGIYMMWLILRAQRHTLHWYQWYRRQCTVTVILPSEDTDVDKN